MLVDMLWLLRGYGDSEDDCMSSIRQLSSPSSYHIDIVTLLMMKTQDQQFFKTFPHQGELRP